MYKKIIWSLSLILCFSAIAFAQIAPVEKSEQQKAVKPASASVQTRYEGGLFGFSNHENGILKFDDTNERLVFFGKDQKEKFSIPYKAMLVIYPQSQSVRSNTGTVVSAVPYAGIFGQFIKKKRRYLIVNFDDPDVKAQGTVNFRINNQDLLDSVIYTLGEKAKLTQRGDAFYRPK